VKLGYSSVPYGADWNVACFEHNQNVLVAADLVLGAKAQTDGLPLVTRAEFAVAIGILVCSGRRSSNSSALEPVVTAEPLTADLMADEVASWLVNSVPDYFREEVAKEAISSSRLRHQALKLTMRSGVGPGLEPTSDGFRSAE
jgi:hypothetical protein